MDLTKAVIFFVGCMVAVCSGLPAQNGKDEVEPVRPVKAYGDQPIVDTGYFTGWDNPFSGNSFGGFFDSIEGVMNRMRQQIDALLNRLPISKGTNSSDESPTFPGFANGVDLPGFPNLGDIDLSKGNTTSVTKVIDGHKVVINETEYKNEDDFGGTFFKVRIIDVKPDSSELTTEKEAETVPEYASRDNKDREDVDNSDENEIFKSKETERLINTENHDNVSSYDIIGKIDNDVFENIETFDEVDPVSTANQHHENTPTNSVEARFSTNKDSEWFEDGTNSQTVDNEWGSVSPVVSIDSNAIDSGENLMEQRPIDLSRDTYVNEILAKNGAPVNPDAEVFFIGQNPDSKISMMERLMDPR